LGDLEIGKIETMAQLRSRLEEISVELEALGSANLPPIKEKNTAVPTIPQSDEPEDSISKTDDMPTVVLTMQLSSLEDAGRTDVGNQRHHNEDYFGIETKIDKLELPKSRVLQGRGLYILCDGMGGHAGGEIASELAVNTLRQYFQKHWIANQLPTEESICEAVYLANEAIYKLNQQEARSGVGRMGTTLAMLLIQDTQAAVAHVGDSRLYRLTRKRGLEQVTVDHEVGQREITRGVEASIAYGRPDAYQLTQALGPRDQNSIDPNVDFFQINEDTLLLLASDGLSDNDLLETHWQTHLEPLLSSGINLEQGVTDLIDLANQHNGHDNITGILVRAKVRPNLES
jgi:protein phosphatase